MQPATVLLLLTTLTTMNAFRIPHNHEDGTYIVELDDRGQVLQIRNITSQSYDMGVRRGPRDLPSRAITLPISDSGCGDGGLNVADFVLARSRLMAACNAGQGIDGHAIRYSNYGSAVVYACSYGGWNPCDGDEYTVADREMDRKCGYYESAWVYMKDWAKSYGRDITSNEICSTV